MNHDKQFQLYADAVKKELQIAYQQGRADERAKVLDEVKNEILDLIKSGIFVTRNDLAEMVSNIIESHE